MELHATLAEWDGDKLTLHDKTQWVDKFSEQVALAFGLKTENVRTISPFVGGAFGSALRTWPHVLIAALAAKMTKRPVKLVCTRAQMYGIPGFRPQSSQKVTLAADRDGKLTAIEHEGTGETSVYEEYTEGRSTQRASSTPATTCHQISPGRHEYQHAGLDACAGRSVRHVRDRNSHGRAGPKLKIDPLELRLRNHADKDPEKDLPWSVNRSRMLPASGGAIRLVKTRARSALDARRQHAHRLWHGHRYLANIAASRPRFGYKCPTMERAAIRTAASDIGPGTYTVMTQIAAEALGLPMEAVRFDLGDSQMPMAPVEGGSMTVASVGSGVHDACLALREKFVELVADDAEIATA